MRKITNSEGVEDSLNCVFEGGKRVHDACVDWAGLAGGCGANGKHTYTYTFELSVLSHLRSFASDILIS